MSEKLLLWRLYYADGSTYDSTQGSHLQAPAFGVQAVVQKCPEEGRHVICQCDYYWYDLKTYRWYGGDFAGLIDFLTHSWGPVRLGRVLAPKEFERIRARADADPDFEPGGVWRSDRHSVPQPGVK